MQFGMGWDAKAPDNGPVDVKATIGEIRRHKPDIVLLQEVEHAQFGGVQVQPAPNYTQIKAALPEFDSWFSYPKADPRELPFGIGLAIFSRTPLLEKLRIDVPSPAIEFVFRGRKTTPTDRVMIGAKTTVGGREIQVYNVHLLAFFMLGISSTMYPWQRDLVADRLAASDSPTILGGDFNVSQGDPLVEQFAELRTARQVGRYSPAQSGASAHNQLATARSIEDGADDRLDRLEHRSWVVRSMCAA